MFEFDEFICFLLRVFVGKSFCPEIWLGQAQYCAKSYWLLISCFRPFVSELVGLFECQTTFLDFVYTV